MQMPTIFPQHPAKFKESLFQSEFRIKQHKIQVTKLDDIECLSIWFKMEQSNHIFPHLKSSSFWTNNVNIVPFWLPKELLCLFASPQPSSHHRNESERKTQSINFNFVCQVTNITCQNHSLIPFHQRSKKGKHDKNSLVIC